MRFEAQLENMHLTRGRLKIAKMRHFPKVFWVKKCAIETDLKYTSRWWREIGHRKWLQVASGKGFTLDERAHAAHVWNPRAMRARKVQGMF